MEEIAAKGIAATAIVFIFFRGRQSTVVLQMLFPVLEREHYGCDNAGGNHDAEHNDESFHLIYSLPVYLLL